VQLLAAIGTCLTSPPPSGSIAAICQARLAADPGVLQQAPEERGTVRRRMAPRC